MGMLGVGADAYLRIGLAYKFVDTANEYTRNCEILDLLLFCPSNAFCSQLMLIIVMNLFDKL